MNEIMVRIRFQLPSLPRAEKVVAEALLENPEAIANFTLSGLAHETGSSDASIVRFCKRMGYSGYTEFKQAFLSAANEESSERPEKIEAQDDMVTILKKVFHSNMQTLTDTLSLVTPNYEKALNAMANAKSIHFFGVGDAYAVCQLTDTKISRMGINCSAYSDVMMQLMTAANQRWCEDEYFDADTRAELKAIADDPQEIKERFYKDLEFGTGGLRGILGAGTNRMNIYTVRKATQGLANFIIKENAQAKGVAIAFDSRHMSPEFAKETALCMAANGIKAYIFPSLRPTPMLSFALRELGCIAGVVVTASHNPPQYNGYKVYWEDGAQITAPKDKQIITEVQAITDFAQVKTMSEEDAKAAGLYEVIGEEIDDRYMEALKKLVLRPEAIKEQADKLKIVYTPLHGTGNIPVRRVLKELGFNNVYVVKEQELPDGDFPTVSYPNPEDKNAFTLALKLAAEVDADIVLATDPDADRLGIYAKNEKTGEYESFTGNMSGMLILEYLLSQKKELGMLPENGAVVTTIVSGKMARAIAKEYNVALIETLTGFKYIGEQIKFFEQNHDHEFLFGYEESYGCLEGTHARDKDAVVAVMALCEAAAYYKSKGITLCEQMEKLYQKYGFYKESLFFQTFPGAEGKAKIDGLMDALRNEPPKQVGPFKVTALEDYKKSVRTDIATGETSALTLPESNVLYFELEDGAWFCVRPSGTEPKIKYYAGVKGTDAQDAADKLEALSKAVVEL